MTKTISLWMGAFSVMAQSHTLLLPTYSDGDNTYTEIYLFNPSETETVSFVIRAWDENGNLMEDLFSGNRSTLGTLFPLQSTLERTSQYGNGPLSGSLEIEATGDLTVYATEVGNPGSFNEWRASSKPLPLENTTSSFQFPSVQHETLDTSVTVSGKRFFTSFTVEPFVGFRNTQAFTVSVDLVLTSGADGIQAGTTTVDVGPRKRFMRRLTQVIPVGQGFYRLDMTADASGIFPFLAYHDPQHGDRIPPQEPTHQALSFPLSVKDDLQSFVQLSHVLNGPLTVEHQLFFPNAMPNQFTGLGAGQQLVDFAEDNVTPGPQFEMAVFDASSTANLNGRSFSFNCNQSVSFSELAPLGHRSVFPLNPLMDFSARYQNSGLVVRNLGPTAPLVWGLLAPDGSTYFTGLEPIEDMAYIPLERFINDLHLGYSILLESPSENLEAAVILVGEAAGQIVTMDQWVPFSIGGELSIGVLPSCFESWHMDVPSCLGAQLTILPFIEFVNDPNCP